MFFLWTIIQFCGLIILSLIIITQIALPPFIDLPYFWLFRKSEKELLKAHDQLLTSKIDKETRETKKQTSKIDRKI